MTLAIIRDGMTEKPQLHKALQDVLDRVKKTVVQRKDEFRLPTDEEFSAYRRRLMVLKATVDPWQSQATRKAR